MAKRRVPDMSRTSLGIRRVGAFVPNLDVEFGGRHIIGRDTRIDKGVSLGGSAREAIVIDFNLSVFLPDIYERIHDEVDDIRAGRRSMLPFFPRVQHNPYLGYAIPLIFSLTKEAMPGVDIDPVINRHGLHNDQKGDLDLFIGNEVGVCRHRALLAGVLIERLIDESYMDGTVRVNRNEWLGGAHAWTRYTRPNNQVVIIDAMQDYCGLINNSRTGLKWDYRNPLDSNLD